MNEGHKKYMKERKKEKKIKKGRKRENMTERSSTKHKENEGKISLTSYCDNS
jgi:hypothetical protein